MRSQKPGELTWAHCLRQWAAFLAVAGYSPSTVREYMGAMLRFIAATFLDPNFATEDDVVAYVASLNPKGSMRGLALRALKSYYRWAEPRQFTGDPTVRFTIPREKYGPAPDLPDEKLVRLVVAAAWHNPRWAWGILFLYGTAARIGSACGVHPEDVRLREPASVYFRVTKNDRPYSVPLEEPALTAARELLAFGHPTLLGVGKGRLWQWVNLSAQQAGLHAWPQLLRHAASTRVARVTDPKTWATFMNHADLSQYHRYVATDEDRVRDAMKRSLSSPPPKGKEVSR